MTIPLASSFGTFLETKGGAKELKKGVIAGL